MMMGTVKNDFRSLPACFSPFMQFYGCSLVAYCKMNNICDEEGEANGGVFR